MTNKPNGTLDTGITNNIEGRAFEHKIGIGSEFSAKYNLHLLVYVEESNTAYSAIEREKQIKSWKRQRKIELIESINPEWKDLFAE